ncbi:Cytochrome c [Aquisphaera giovannonii]|uniref:Cytochrome c n=1 Tax=Aquisphaera giovannonii TaxID=406548 RepID=A0A5B9W6P6_9BACT|nr:PVC-type heme-binding CxxCH protein [Aquisphaera giovannonii]QEH35651.1 Cytochrome c [Aquisphaera giovannonii]
MLHHRGPLRPPVRTGRDAGQAILDSPPEGGLRVAVAERSDATFGGQSRRPKPCSMPRRSRGVAFGSAPATRACESLARLALVATFLAVLIAPRALADKAPTPDESRAAMRLADPSLAIELVAAEPDVSAPVAMAWDEHGAMYVVEMTDYPISPDGGRVKRLEDRDGDGRYERVTTFADGLHWPSGVLPWNGGILVTAAPDLLFFKDTDGDGRADVRTVILTGFFEGNQQLRVNSPTWGMDNRVYLANGRSGGSVRRPGEPDSKAVPILRNDLRVDPATGRAQAVAGFSQFGLPRDDWGDRFPSWNTVPIRHVVLEPGEVGPSANTVADILDLSDGGRVYSIAPAQKRFNVETVAFFNATCGPTIERGGLLGDAYRGDAFFCEPLTSLVQRRKLVPDGPTYIARRAPGEADREFLASAHPWFRPVNLATGPDGALYVADFCRAWVEHPDFVPEGQRKSVDFREGFEHGRIWRVAPRGSEPGPPAAKPGSADAAGLVALLESPNGWCRDTAQRLLVERRDLATVPALRRLAAASKLPLARAHALWTLRGLDALDDETLRAALRDDSPRVREQAARLVADSARQPSFASELAAIADDADARVRLRAVVALAKLDTDLERDALARVAARDAESPWAAAAILGALESSPGKFLDILATRQPGWLARPTDAQLGFLASLGAQIGASADRALVADALARAAAAPAEAAGFALLQGIARGQARAGSKAFAWPSLEPASPPLRQSVRRLLDAAAAKAKDPAAPLPARDRALAAILAARDPAARGLIPILVNADQPATLQSAAARAVASAGDPALADALLSRWDDLSLATRRVLLGALSGSPALAGRLVEAVASKRLEASEIDPGTRDALRRLADPALAKRLAGVFPAAGADRRAVLERYAPALSAGSPDPARGRELFAKNCQTCHTRGGGAKVGPDLLSVAGRPPADLMVAILDPSREVAPDGVAVVVATARGDTLTGLLVEETPSSLRLRRAEGLEDVIPRADVEALRSTGRSLMPDGLEQNLTPADLADLIAYLKSPEPPAGAGR